MEGQAWHLVNDGTAWRSVYLVCGDGVLSLFEEDDGEPSIPMRFGGMSSNELVLTEDQEGPAADAHLGPNEAGAPSNFGFSVVKGSIHLKFCASSKQDLIKWRKCIKNESGASSAPPPAPADDSQAQQLQGEIPLPAPMPMPSSSMETSTGQIRKDQSGPGSVNAPNSPMSGGSSENGSEAHEEDNLGDDEDNGNEDEDNHDTEEESVVEMTYHGDENQHKSDSEIEDAEESSQQHYFSDQEMRRREQEHHGEDFRAMDEEKSVDPTICAAPGEVESVHGSVYNEGHSQLDEFDREQTKLPTPPPRYTAAPPPRVEAPYVGAQEPHLMQTIVIHYGDTEVHISFRNQNDLNRVTVTELKGSMCMKLNAEPDAEYFLRPSEVDLLLGNAVLREHWCGRDFGLRGGLHLQSKRRTARPYGSLGGGINTVRVVAQIRAGGREIPVQVRDGERVEDVAEALGKQLGLDEPRQMAFLMEIYRQRGDRFASENASLKNQVGELLHRTKSQRLGKASNPVSQGSQESYEALLDRAAERIQALEREKKQLADQVFQLRILNAERLSVLE